MDRLPPFDQLAVLRSELESTLRLDRRNGNAASVTASTRSLKC